MSGAFPAAWEIIIPPREAMAFEVRDLRFRVEGGKARMLRRNTRLQSVPTSPRNIRANFNEIGIFPAVDHPCRFHGISSTARVLTILTRPLLA